MVGDEFCGGDHISKTHKGNKKSLSGAEILSIMHTCTHPNFHRL
jgi:hypothetical protein